MIAEIIEQMRKELYDTQWCKNDFEKYDLKTLENTNEPFFWLVRECGTSLQMIGPTTIYELLQNESARLELMRNKYAILDLILYWNGNSNKYFYWDGYELKAVGQNEIQEIFDNIWGKEIAGLSEKYPEEANVANKPLELVMYDEVKKRLDSELEFAASIGDNSLQDCLDRLTSYQRQAVNHCVRISTEFAPHSFGFVELINNQSRIVGGIIYSEYSKQNHWAIHT